MQIMHYSIHTKGRASFLLLVGDDLRLSAGSREIQLPAYPLADASSGIVGGLVVIKEVPVVSLLDIAHIRLSVRRVAGHDCS